MDLSTFFYFYALPATALITFYIYRLYSHWSDKGVGGPMAIWPFGFIVTWLLSDPIEYELKNMNKYGHVYGLYTGVKPTLTISDVELVKRVMIKDFHLFVNRREFNILDKIWQKNLFFIADEDWKRIRSITSPAFTSGKLRRMFPLLKKATDKLEHYFEGVVANGQATVDIKKVIAGFTIDVIASTSFGTDTDSNGDRTKSNPFVHHGRRLLNDASLWKTIAIFTMPKTFLRLMNIQHDFPEDSWKFFNDVTRTMVDRGGQQENLVKLLKEASVSEEELANLNYNKLTATSDVDNSKADAAGVVGKGNKHLTDDEVIAQCILFFIAGYETTASTISHALFMMVHNPEVQKKLYRELTNGLSDLDQTNLNEYYEAITNPTRFPYLEAVLKETLRKYPVVPRLERRLAADDYELGGVKLERDTLVEVSAVAVHYDERNYPDPHRFDPERFMPENKDKLISGAYLPFGTGPRNCIGMRFAYQEAKICLAALAQKFVFKKSAKTPEKLRFPVGTGALFAEPFDLAVESR